MGIFISILRGINVGGHNKLPMQELKKLYEKLGLDNPLTYIQSGNVIFQYRGKDLAGLQNLISAEIHKKYGFEVPVIIRTLAEMEILISGNPFLKMKGIDIVKLHITFLDKEPRQEYREKISANSYAPDLFEFHGREVYLYCPQGYGRTKLNNTFFESKLKATATTRNWKTVNELARIAASVNTD